MVASAGEYNARKAGRRGARQCQSSNLSPAKRPWRGPIPASASQVIREYVEHVQRLGPDQAGRVTLSPGDTMATVRRRLGAAIKATGKNVQIKRVGTDIYFWEEPVKRRGGRPRKNATA